MRSTHYFRAHMYLLQIYKTKLKVQNKGLRKARELFPIAQAGTPISLPTPRPRIRCNGSGKAGQAWPDLRRNWTRTITSPP